MPKWSMESYDCWWFNSISLNAVIVIPPSLTPSLFQLPPFPKLPLFPTAFSSEVKKTGTKNESNLRTRYPYPHQYTLLSPHFNKSMRGPDEKKKWNTGGNDSNGSGGGGSSKSELELEDVSRDESGLKMKMKNCANYWVCKIRVWRINKFYLIFTFLFVNVKVWGTEKKYKRKWKKLHELFIVIQSEQTFR